MIALMITSVSSPADKPRRSIIYHHHHHFICL